jgi:Mrp family chromosome partitioning ATPase
VKRSRRRARDSSDTGMPPEVLEALQHFVNNRELAGTEPLPPRVAVTSTSEGEGVSTVVSGLAAVLASEFATIVVLVDLSWLGRAKRTDPQVTDPGIKDVVSGEALLDDVLVDADDPNVLRLGEGVGDAHLVVPRSEDLDVIVGELTSSFDHVLLDMPPVLDGSAGLPLFRLADAYVLVVRSGVTHADQVTRATRQLSEVPLAGSVLNRQRSRVPAALQRLGSE